MYVLLTNFDTITGIPVYTACFPGIPVRLSGGYSNEEEGRVEVFMNNVWGTICDAGWDSVDTRIVCNTLFGYRYIFLLDALSKTHKTEAAWTSTSLNNENNLDIIRKIPH